MLFTTATILTDRLLPAQKEFEICWRFSRNSLLRIHHVGCSMHRNIGAFTFRNHDLWAIARGASDL